VRGDGKIGIGTSSPDLRLDVSGTEEYMAIIQSSNADATVMKIDNTGSGGRQWGFISGATNYAAGGVGFYIRDFDASSNRMSIDSSGNTTFTGTVTAPTFIGALTGNASGSSATFTSTSQNSQFNSIGVGTAGSGTGGEIRATNEVTAYYSSDIALKTNIKPISNPLDKLLSLGGYNFDWKEKVIRDRGGEDGFFVRKEDVGIIAQEIEKVIPEIVVTRKDGTKAVKYEKIVPLLIESIKELTAKVIRLENGNN
jgi:hypothetical protein